MNHTMQVTVIGAGVMGTDIAQTCAQQGLQVNVFDTDEGALHFAKERIERALNKATEKGSLTRATATEATNRVKIYTDLAKALSGADLVIEAVPEILSLKQEIFSKLDALAPESATLASNTSSINISEIAIATTRPERVIGLHFFQPVPLVPAVELISGSATSQSTVEAAKDFLSAIDREPLYSKDSPGFIVNRLLPHLLNESLRLVEEQVATAEDVDRACTLVLKHPIGPLRMADLAGLDTVLLVLEHMHQELGERYQPSQLLKELVAEGKLGRKSGQGIYTYST